MFKHAGKYYLITSGCTSWVPNAARLAVASSIWGPWTALGNPCIGKDSGSTFHGQSTFVLPVPDKPTAFIFMPIAGSPTTPLTAGIFGCPSSSSTESRS